MRALARRLEALEEVALPTRRTILLWKEYGETTAQVISRHVAAHPEDADTDKFVVSWRSPHNDEAYVDPST